MYSYYKKCFLHHITGAFVSIYVFGGLAYIFAHLR